MEIYCTKKVYGIGTDDIFTKWLAPAMITFPALQKGRSGRKVTRAFYSSQVNK